MSMSAHQPLPLSPDLEEAERHLMLLDEGCATWIFQVFDDDKRRKDKALARVLIGTLEEHVAELTRLNRLGAGIFVAVNRMAGAKRGNAQVVGLRALWREMDQPHAAVLPLEPQIVIESSPGKRHEYLLLAQEATPRLELWRGVQRALVRDYGSDKAVTDPARVLRLAGFYHQKDPARPHRVRILHESGALPYGLDAVAAAIPPVIESALAPGAGASGDADMGRVRRLAFSAADRTVRDGGVSRHREIYQLGCILRREGLPGTPEVLDEALRVFAANMRGTEAGSGAAAPLDWTAERKTIADGWNAAQGSIRRNPPPVQETAPEAPPPDDLPPLSAYEEESGGPRRPSGAPDLRVVDGGRAAPGGAGKRRGPVIQQDVLEEMLERFTLIYSTRTVWDAQLRLIVALDALGAAFPAYVRLWKENPRRKMVQPDQVVFDPGAAEAEGRINLFGGLQMQPKRGSCERVLQLVNHLCGGEPQVIEWLLCWMALPLQRPGAKMRSAVVMHGDEGAGKNLLWDIVAQIYGEYASLISQDQIESKYNGWLSKKLLIIANEVVSRQELRHQKGKLKALITDPTVQIEDKFLPVRQEANHANLVFLSNEIEPVTVDASDRRYLVLWTPPKREPEFYRAVVEEWRAGGAEAFFWHLLHRVDCSAFDEHTKPLMTAAKARLVVLGLPSAQLFYREWSEGLLAPLEVCPCRSADLYEAYRRWCGRNGERFPSAMKYFSREIERHLEKDRCRLRLVDGRSDQATYFHIGPPLPPGADKSAWYGTQVGYFATSLEQYLDGGSPP